jgi:hypothetical protein
MVQTVERAEEALHVDLGGFAGVQHVLLVFSQGVAQQQLHLEQRDVFRAGDRTLEFDLEGLTDVDHRAQTQLAQLQGAGQADLQIGFARAAGCIRRMCCCPSHSRPQTGGRTRL